MRAARKGLDGASAGLKSLEESSARLSGFPSMPPGFMAGFQPMNAAFPGVAAESKSMQTVNGGLSGDTGYKA